MAQPTIDGLTLNPGSGGSNLAGDNVSGAFWQSVLVGYSTGDGSANVVMADTGLPVVAASGATWEVTNSGTFAVQVDSSTLPTGAATEAKQDTGNASLSSIDGKITACNTGAVVVSSMPTTTVTATDLDIRDISQAQDSILAYANTAKDGTGTSYVPIVDSDGHLQVDILSGGTSGTQYQEDTAHTTGDTGTLALGVRKDTAASLCDADGDYTAPIFDSNGRLHTTVGNTVTVDCNSSNVTVDGVPAPLNVTGGGTEASALRVTLANDSTGVISVDDNGGSLTVDNAGTFAVQSTLQTGDNVAGRVKLTDGTEVASVNASNYLEVAIAQDDVGIGGGTQYTEDDVVPANPVGTATMAERDDALAGLAVAEGDWTHLYTDAYGALWVIPRGTVTVDGSGVTQPVSAVSLPLPTGAATEAKQDTGNASLSSIDGKITACDTSDVGVTSVIPGTGATNLGKAEDSAHASGDVGVMLLAVRNDAGSALADTDGDYVPLSTDSTCSLYVAAGTSGGMYVQGATAENSAVFYNPLLAGGRYDSTERTLDSGDVGAFALSEAGEAIAIPQVGYLMNGMTRCQVKRFHVTTSTSDTSIITAVAGKKFSILSMYLMALGSTPTNVYLETKTTNTPCFGNSANPIPLAVDADGDNIAGLTLQWNPGGWFQTADANEDLAIILSAAQPVLICGNYIEVD